MNKTRINNFDESLYYEKLKNGLEIYVVPNKNKKRFAAMLMVKYGGRDINFKINNKKYNTPTGIAHFLEHKMFEKDDPPFDFYSKFGSDVNAQTSDDYTGYYFIGTKGFTKSLIYLFDWISSLSITEKQVEKEKGIILEEANMYKDNPNSILYKKIKNNIFVKDPKRNEVIGTDEDIKRITKQDLDLCYNTFYNTSSMVLIVTGNVNVKKVFEIARENSKKLNSKKIEVERLYGKEPDEVFKKSETIKMDLGIPKIAVAYKINKKVFNKTKLNDYQIMVLLNMIYNIGLGQMSDIRDKWLKDNLFTNAYFNISQNDNFYIIEFYATSEKQNELLKELNKYLPLIKLSKDLFEKEKKGWIATEIRNIENPVNVMYSVLEDVLDFNTYITDKNEIIKNLKYEDLEKVNSLISYKNKTVIKLDKK